MTDKTKALGSELNDRLCRWISCDEEMPNLGQEVLLYFDSDKDEAMIELGYTSFRTIGEYTGYDDDPWEGLDANAAYEDGARPSHWMRLPEPPAA